MFVRSACHAPGLPEPPVPHAALADTRNPPVPASTQFPAVNPITAKFVLVPLSIKVDPMTSNATEEVVAVAPVLDINVPWVTFKERINLEELLNTHSLVLLSAPTLVSTTKPSGLFCSKTNPTPTNKRIM